MPTPPTPTTTTVSPVLVPPIWAADPQPVATPQPSSAASFERGDVALDLDQRRLVDGDVLGERAEQAHLASRPSCVVRRLVLSEIARPLINRAPSSQMFCSPREQGFTTRRRRG